MLLALGTNLYRKVNPQRGQPSERSTLREVNPQREINPPSERSTLPQGNPSSGQPSLKSMQPITVTMILYLVCKKSRINLKNISFMLPKIISCLFITLDCLSTI